MRPNGLTSRRQIVLRLSTPRRKHIRTAEVIGSGCLATDLAIGLPDRAPPAEHPARVAASIGWASRLSSPPGRSTTACCPMPVARPTRTLQPRCFPTVRCSIEHFSPVMYGSPAQTMRGILRVLSDPDRFAFSGSIRRHGMRVNGQLVVPAGGQLNAQNKGEAGAQRVSRWPQN
jgi:hypothetical protein